MTWRKYWKVQNRFNSNEEEVNKVDKDGNENIVTISYKIKCTGGARFMASSLSNLLIILRKKFTKLNVKIAIVF